MSEAVWGAGWYTGAQHTNYADSQMQFSGALTFELQGGLPTVWNLITDWLVNWRVYPQSMIVSPNGLAIQSFQITDTTNSRQGVWLNSAAFTIDPAASIKLNCNVIGLLRTETYSATTYRAVSSGGRQGTTLNVPTLPLNPAPINRNPFPGWSAQTQINLWPPNYPPPGAPPNYSSSNPTGMFLMGADWTFNNNCQVIRGCVIGDARILTSRGYEKIASVADAPERILSEFGIQNAQGIVYRGKEQHVRVRTRLQNDVRVSLDHRFEVMRGDGTLGFKAAKDLQQGDWLLCQRGHGGLIPDDRGGSIKQWYALGHLYGDGWMHKGELVWQVAENKRELEPLLVDFFKSEVIHYREDHQGPSDHGDVHRTESINQFYTTRGHQAFKCLPAYAPNGNWRAAGFPEEVWTLGERQIAAFLRGLFSTDGDVDGKGQTRLSTKYRQIARDTKKALGLLGILATIMKRPRRTPFGVSKQWIVTVVGARSRPLFAQKVGFSISWKQDQLDQYLASRKRGGNCKTCYIPYGEILLRALFPRSHWLTTKDKNELATTEGISRVLRDPANALAESFVPRVIDRAVKLGASGVELQLLKMYQAQGWYFDQVTRIDPGHQKIDVYTVYESDSHSYMCEGIIHANCTGEPNPAAIMQGVMAVEGTVRLFRDGVIPDPYAYQWPPTAPFTASQTNIMMALGGGVPPPTTPPPPGSSSQFPMILFRHVLLTTEEFAIAGQNEPVPRTFGFGGLGDGTAPPMDMLKLA